MEVETQELLKDFLESIAIASFEAYQVLDVFEASMGFFVAIHKSLVESLSRQPRFVTTDPRL